MRVELIGGEIPQVPEDSQTFLVWPWAMCGVLMCVLLVSHTALFSVWPSWRVYGMISSDWILGLHIDLVEVNHDDQGVQMLDPEPRTSRE